MEEDMGGGPNIASVSVREHPWLSRTENFPIFQNVGRNGRNIASVSFREHPLLVRTEDGTWGDY